MSYDYLESKSNTLFSSKSKAIIILLAPQAPLTLTFILLTPILSLLCLTTMLAASSWSAYLVCRSATLGCLSGSYRACC